MKEFGNYGIKPWYRIIQELFGMKPIIRVRVLKAEKNKYVWWRKYIGEEFDIKEITVTHFITFRSSDQGYGIDRDEAEVIFMK